MQIKLEDLLNIEKPLSDLLQTSLPIKLSYKLGKLVKKVGKELSEFYETRDKLIKKYGVPGEKEGEYKIDLEDKTAIESFQNELKELTSIEIELDFLPISIEDFDNINLNLTPMQVSQLMAFFTE